jgi:alpha-glucosidase
VIKALPSTWDETIVLPAAASARRRRSRGGRRRMVRRRAERSRGATLKVDLKFLGAASYRALLVRDDPDNAAAERIDACHADASGRLTITMRPGGGFIARLVPVKAGS